MQTMSKNNTVFFFICLWVIGCTPHQEEKLETGYYVTELPSQSEGLILLKTISHQQTTDYTCGPSAALNLLNYFGIEGDEMSISEGMHCNDSIGTTPDNMANWFKEQGLKSSWHEGGTLELLQERLAEAKPTLVEWSDWGGHWVLVIGYDTRGTESISDDVIIFADPYDFHDDNPDGITWFNAERFYYMWYDELLFGRLMERVWVDVSIPKG